MREGRAPPRGSWAAEMGSNWLDISYDVRFTCQQCGDCCRGLNVTLLPGEKERLEAFDWASASPRLAEEDLFVPVPARGGPAGPLFHLAQREGSCVFLEEDRRCLIHDRLGYAAKPLVCRQFPLVFAEEPSTTVVSASFACRSVAEHVGRPLRDQEVEIRALLEDPLGQEVRDKGVQVSGRLSVPDRIVLTAQIGLDWYSYQALEMAMVAMLEEDTHTLAVRLLAVHNLVEGAVAQYGRGIKTTASFSDWIAHMKSDAGQYWLYQEASAGRAGSPGRQRATLAPLISLVEARWAAERGVAQAKGMLGQAVALAQGRGPVLLPSLEAGIHLEEMSRVIFDQDSPRLQPVLVRYLGECLRRKVMLRQPSVRKGSYYLLVYFALVRWYAVALAVARSRGEAGVEELREAIRTVEKCYVHHNLLPKLLAEQATVASLMSLLMDLVSTPADLVTNFYRGSGGSRA